MRIGGVPQIEDDTVLLTSYRVSRSQVADSAETRCGSGWKRCEGQVYLVDPTVWSTSSPLGMERAVDDLFKYLVREK